MINEHVKISTFDEMPKVPDGQIHCQKFPVECAVPGLRRL